MSVLSKHHKELTDGKGKCSVPMWMGGCPGGFCDEDAFGERPESDGFRDPYTGQFRRFDGKYDGYVPALACPSHGGPKQKDEKHMYWGCKYCGENEIPKCHKCVREDGKLVTDELS